MTDHPDGAMSTAGRSTASRLLDLRRGFSEQDQFGWFPWLSLVVAGGVLVMAFANVAARNEHPLASPLMWLSLIAIVLPVVARLLGTTAERTERLALVLLLCVAFYLVKVLHSPGAFTMFDEFLHWRTSDLIVESGRLFQPNNILPASPFYPGIEVLASALRSFGFPVYEAGILIVGAARVLCGLVLFLLYERAASSARIAGIAAFIYMANPAWIMFDAQFSYESLALPIAIGVFWLVARRVGERGWRAVGFTIAILLGIIAVAVTHHISSYAMCGFLLLWAAVWVVRRPANAGIIDGPVGPALMAITMSIGWLLSIATITVGYLAPAFDGALREVIQLVSGERSGRVLFRTATGLSAPVWEQLVGYASVGIVVLSLPVGLLRGWLRLRSDPLALALMLASLAYPASQIGRLTERGAELSARTSEFLFLGVAFVVALAISEMRLPRWEGRRIGARPAEARVGPPWAGRAIASVLCLVMLMGGFILGVPFWARLPGPYLVAGDTRSIEELGITTAQWTREHLGPGNRMMTDRTNRLLLATYGGQHPISAVGDQINVRAAFFAQELTEDELRILRRAGVRYVVVDYRLTTALPTVGVYVERGEARQGRHETPLPAAALDKYERLPEASRIYDSGEIRIYDIGRALDVAQ